MMDGKIDQCVCIKFCVKLSKSATKAIEMLREAFGEHSEAGQWFVNGIHISRPGECQLKMTNFQGDQIPAKQQKMLKKFETSSTETINQQSMIADTIWITCGVCQEILTENLNMHPIAAKFVPQILTNDRKQRHVEVCLEL
jgi:hypothetical protein